jgi:IclR family acetate operon transcriptional repressor
MNDKVPALSSAIRILERLADEWPQPLAPGVLITELGLNRSTCYNILATLLRAGWVSTQGTRGGYTLGPNLFGIANLLPGVLEVAMQEELESLARETGLSSFAARPERDGEYLVVASAVPDRDVHVVARLGARLAFSAPAMLLVHTAWMPEDKARKLIEAKGLHRYTDHTVTDVDEFIGLLDDVRRDGYGVSLRQFNSSHSAVAAPVFDKDGQIVLALSILAFESDLDSAESTERAGRAVRAAADRVSARIGGSGVPSLDSPGDASGRRAPDDDGLTAAS